MATTQTEIEISDQELDSLNHAIFTKYGYDFSAYKKTCFKRRITRIIHKHGMDSVLDVWRKLLFEPEFFTLMKDDISVGMTEMFRNPDFWQDMSREILPRFAPQKAIHIWHAGCATGEEVYTMAILLHELKLQHKTSALASDLSDKFIDIAQKGRYDSDFLKWNDPNYVAYKGWNGSLSAYMHYRDEHWAFKDFMKEHVHFKQENLVTDGHGSQTFDLILCRNVMIYFNDQLKIKTLKKFCEALKPNGLLCIGYFDTMPQGYQELFEHDSAGSKTFRKKV
jgi:chemotaxis protein methyltransferase CheR